MAYPLWVCRQAKSEVVPDIDYTRCQVRFPESFGGLITFLKCSLLSSESGRGAR